MMARIGNNSFMPVGALSYHSNRDRLEEAGSSKEISRTTLCTPPSPAARTQDWVLAAPRHINCRGKTTRKYADRPQKHRPNNKWTLHWLEFCKYQLLDWSPLKRKTQAKETRHWTAHLSQQLSADLSSALGRAFPTKPYQLAHRYCQEHTHPGEEAAPEQHLKLSLNNNQDRCFKHKHLPGSQRQNTKAQLATFWPAP